MCKCCVPLTAKVEEEELQAEEQRKSRRPAKLYKVARTA